MGLGLHRGSEADSRRNRINRSTFTEYLKDVIYKQPKSQCFKPSVKCALDGLDIYYEVSPDYDGLDTSKMKVETPGVKSDGTIFTIRYQDSADDRAGLGGGMGWLELKNIYNCTVKVKGNKIYADSDYTVHLYARALQNRNEADVFRKVFNEALTHASRNKADNTGDHV